MHGRLDMAVLLYRQLIDALQSLLQCCFEALPVMLGIVLMGAALPGRLWK
jgi:hypothetical protein